MNEYLIFFFFCTFHNIFTFIGVDQVPHLEVPYPLTNGGQQLRHTSGRFPVHHSVRYIHPLVEA